MGTLFDAGVWYYVKNLKIFEEDGEEMQDVTKDNEKKWRKKQERNNVKFPAYLT